MTEPDSLGPLHLKLDRAEQHLMELDGAIGRYLEGEAREPVLNPQADGETIVVEIPMLKKPPSEQSVIIGDILHNLRSVLDHLAWQLVLANGRVPSDTTQFPIYDDRLTRKGNPRTWPIADEIGAAAFAVVEGFQPYHRPQPSQDSLAIVHRLSNIDKHRHLHLTRGATTGVTCTLHFPGHPPMRLPTFVPRPTDDNTLIVGVAKVPGGRAALPREVEMELMGADLVSLDEGPVDAPVLVTLKDALEFERQTVLPAFTPFLN